MSAFGGKRTSAFEEGGRLRLRASRTFLRPVMAVISRQTPFPLFSRDALPIWLPVRRGNDPMHNDADLTSRKASCGRNFSARLHILDDLIYVISFVNNDLGYSKTGQVSRDAQFRAFELR